MRVITGLTWVTGLASTTSAFAIERATPPAVVTPLPDNFKCKSGFVLTAYTSQGVATCTRESGSSLSVGYSSQAVVFVGLTTSLTTLIIAVSPLGQYVYKSALGYFAKPGTGWQNAFPRHSITEDSAVSSGIDRDVRTHLHRGWDELHEEMQKRSFDPASTIVLISTNESTSARIVHNDYIHTHSFDLIPHNETHSTWEARYDVALQANGSLEQRQLPWTGARIVVSTEKVKGIYPAVKLPYAQVQPVAEGLVNMYLGGIDSYSELCGFMGTTGTARNKYQYIPFMAEISIVSQKGLNGGYPASTCPSNFLLAVDDGDYDL